MPLREKKTRSKKIESGKQYNIEELQSNSVGTAKIEKSSKSSISCRFENCHCCKHTFKDAVFMKQSEIVNESKSKSTNLNNNDDRPLYDRYNFRDANKIKNEVQRPDIDMEQNITCNNTGPSSSIYDYNEEDNKVDECDNIDSNRTCLHCKIVFQSPLDLLRHKRDCHNFPRPILAPDEVEKYFDCPNRNFCPICKKPIKTKNFRSVFIKHLLTHTTGVTYECSVCKKLFKRRDHMRTHEKRHIVSL